MDNENRHSSSDAPRKKTARGGWRAVRFILGNETFEKLASMSLIGNLVLYLHTMYNLDNVASAYVFQIWGGTTNFAPLAGAFLADAYLGRFYTLLFGSIASFLGMGVLSLGAGLPQMRPPPCISGESSCPQPQPWQLGFLYLGLGLIVVGAGGIRPCNISFGADQFDTNTEKGRAKLESFLNWWYLLFSIALVIALTIVVYVQTNISWTLGFAIPTACFVVSILIFLSGRRFYVCKAPQGSVFSDLAKVVVAMFRKRKIPKPNQIDHLHNPPMNSCKLAHTDRFLVFDKAATVVDSSIELDEEGKSKDEWRLCSVHQVEQFKCVVGIIPVWLAGIACFISMQQMGSFGILQAIQMNRFIGPHFQIPPAWMSLTPMIALSIWIYIYEKYVEFMKKKTHSNKRFSMKTRIEIGIVMSVLCMVVAGLLEKLRRDAAVENKSFVSPLHVWMLIPEFALSGLTEAFAAIAVMELLTTHLPESLRTVAGAIFFLSLSLASYLSSVLMGIVSKIGRMEAGEMQWLGGNDLNKNRLDYFFYVVGGIAALNFFYFRFFAAGFLPSPDVDPRQKAHQRQLEDAELGRR
ncbi:protein NRT1/ PTR FAMILY 2.8-like isoform X1 [Benincasa hispida]|uniref:protein NRT1/ PTR FAMILY 2.8-like isoform X1 n=2 Tax=Benincasa hispida TaxID=102211 RepID=UPI0018FFCD3E|nr:protein NRT1/ PTR FAMILY 2.8-like isoform X1 [Benincasa hispida]XP_038881206.1 protein NRT1/ PTR FAMILY 2.8-like isoform X1 [Benincasa hispida]